MCERPTYDTLKSTIETLDGLSQDGFSEIATLAQMALAHMETPGAYLWPETLAQVLRTIRAKAEDIENLINCEAEQVGCHYQDPATERRYEAQRAAEARLKESRHA